jgi:hypothetical protein
LSFPQRPPDEIYCLHLRANCPKTVKPLSAMVGTKPLQSTWIGQDLGLRVQRNPNIPPSRLWCH